MTISDAMTRGVKKATRMYLNPDPKQLRASRRTISQRNLVQEAWAQTGQAMNQAITEVRKTR